MSIDRNEVRQIVLETIETMLELQLRAIRQIQGSEELPPPVRIKRGLRKRSGSRKSNRELKQRIEQ